MLEKNRINKKTLMLHYHNMYHIKGTSQRTKCTLKVFKTIIESNIACNYKPQTEYCGLKALNLWYTIMFVFDDMQ